MSLRGSAFVTIPEWVLFHPDVTNRALRLFGVLASHLNRRTGKCCPSRETLAGEMGCSVDSVDRAGRELIAMGALVVQPHYDGGGRQQSNDYVLRFDDPSLGGGEGRSSAAPEGRNGAAPYKEPDEEEPDSVTSSPSPTAMPMVATVDDERCRVKAEVAPWRLTLERHRTTIAGRRSWDLLNEVYLPAYDDLQKPGADPITRNRIALVCHFIEDTADEKLSEQERAMVARTVRRYGKVALVGWDKAWDLAHGDTPRDRMAYAIGCIRKTCDEILPVASGG